MGQEITDPKLLAQLNAPDAAPANGDSVVTDPDLLAKLNAPETGEETDPATIQFRREHPNYTGPVPHTPTWSELPGAMFGGVIPSKATADVEGSLARGAIVAPAAAATRLAEKPFTSAWDWATGDNLTQREDAAWHEAEGNLSRPFTKEGQEMLAQAGQDIHDSWVGQKGTDAANAIDAKFGKGATDTALDVLQVAPVLGGFIKGARTGWAEMSAAQRLAADIPATEAAAASAERPFGTAPQGSSPDPLGRPTKAGISAPAAQEARAAHLDSVLNEGGGDVPVRTSAVRGDAVEAGAEAQIAAKAASSDLGKLKAQQFEQETEAMRKYGAQTASMAAGADADGATTAETSAHIEGSSRDQDATAGRGAEVRAGFQAIEGAEKGEVSAKYTEAENRATKSGVTVSSLPELDKYLQDPKTKLAAVAGQNRDLLDAIKGYSDSTFEAAPKATPTDIDQLRKGLQEARTPSNRGIIDGAKAAIDRDMIAASGSDGYAEAHAAHSDRMNKGTGQSVFEDLFGKHPQTGVAYTADQDIPGAFMRLPVEEQSKVLTSLEKGAAHPDEAVSVPSKKALNALRVHAVNNLLDGTSEIKGQAKRGNWSDTGFSAKLAAQRTTLKRLFDTQPEVLKRLQKLDDAGKQLHADPHYPGAAAQAGVYLEMEKKMAALAGARGQKVADVVGAIAGMGGVRMGDMGHRVASRVAGWFGKKPGEVSQEMFRQGVAPGAQARQDALRSAAGTAAWPPQKPQGPAGGPGTVRPQMAPEGSRPAEAPLSFEKMIADAQRNKAINKAFSDQFYQGNKVGVHSSSDMLDNIRKSSQSDPRISAISNVLKAVLPDMTVRTATTPTVRVRGFDALGYYEPGEHMITLAKDAPVQTVLHEMVHAASSRWLDANPDHAITKDLEALRQHVVKTIDPRLLEARSLTYGLTDVHELLAEAFTKSNFQKLLDGISYKKTTAWSHLVNRVGRMLGIVRDSVGSTGVADSALEHVMMATNEIMKQQQKMTRGGAQAAVDTLRNSR